MNETNLPKEMLRRVSPNDARAYARSRGWEKVPNVKGNYTVFRLSPEKLDQIIVPADNRIDDYADRVQDMVYRLAEVEDRLPIQVLSDVLNHDADIFRCRVINPQTELGSLSLNDATSMLDGIRRSLLSAAHSVIHPQTYHPRLSRREATQLIQACRFQQTERGSFVVAVSCPLRAVDFPQHTLFGESDSFTRSTTRYLQRSLSQLSHSIQEDSLEEIVEPNSGSPIVSANLCDALLRLRPESEESELELSVSWAASSSPESRPHESEPIRFTADDFLVVEDIYLRLAPDPQPHSDMFLGVVDELRGSTNSSDQREGDVVLSLYLQHEIIRARVELSPDWYEVANRSHMENLPVVVRGSLRRGRKLSRLTNLKLFKLLEGMDEAEPSNES